MNGLKKYDPNYRITDKWIAEFRSWLERNITILQESDNHILFDHCGYVFQLTNNGLEFNLSFVNIWDHESIPYVKNKKAVDPGKLVLDEIMQRVKKDIEWKEKPSLSELDAEYMNQFLQETRNIYNHKKEREWL